MRTLLFLGCLLLATSCCSSYPATQAGTTARKGAATVTKRPLENRHWK